MKIGQRVIVFAHWNSFIGLRGEITQVEPFTMVHIDGERVPMRIEEQAIVPEESSRDVAAITNE